MVIGTETDTDMDMNSDMDTGARIEANQSKLKQIFRILWHYICFASKVVIYGSTETLKQLAVLLFRGTTETNLFVSDCVQTSFGSNFGLFYMNRVS
jgi:hypothetical protein